MIILEHTEKLGAVKGGGIVLRGSMMLQVWAEWSPQKGGSDGSNLLKLELEADVAANAAKEQSRNPGIVSVDVSVGNLAKKEPRTALQEISMSQLHFQLQLCEALSILEPEQRPEVKSLKQFTSYFLSMEIGNHRFHSTFNGMGSCFSSRVDQCGWNMLKLDTDSSGQALSTIVERTLQSWLRAKHRSSSQQVMVIQRVFEDMDAIWSDDSQVGQRAFSAFSGSLHLEMLWH